MSGSNDQSETQLVVDPVGGGDAENPEIHNDNSTPISPPTLMSQPSDFWGWPLVICAFLLGFIWGFLVDSFLFTSSRRWITDADRQMEEWNKRRPPAGPPTKEDAANLAEIEELMRRLDKRTGPRSDSEVTTELVSRGTIDAPK
jgi:hypothetical protein